MNKVLLIPSDDSGCGVYRIIQPYEDIQLEGFKFDIWNKANPTEFDAFSYDAVVIQRPQSKEDIKFIKDLKVKNIKVVVETDDNIHEITPDNPHYELNQRNNKEMIRNYERCLKLADSIHCSTPELTNYTKQFNPNVETFFNAIDFERIEHLTNVRSRFLMHFKLPPNAIILMWAGSATHKASLEIIKEAVEKICTNNPRAFFVVNTDIEWFKEQGFKIPQNKVIMLDWVATNEFPKLLSIPDIMLIPIPDTEFNRSKSELKVLQASTHGVPSICSPVAPYNRFSKTIYAKDDEWEQTIIRLIDNKQLRKKIGKEARINTYLKYNLKIINEQRKQFWLNFIK